MKTRLLFMLGALIGVLACASFSGPGNDGAKQVDLPMTITALTNQLTAVSPSPQAANQRPTGSAANSPSPASIVPASSSGGPTIANCPAFPADNYWNTRIDSLPIDPNSSDYITSLDPTLGLHPDFGSGLYDGGPIGIPFMVIPAGTTSVTIDFYYGDESDTGSYPIPPNPLIEGGADSDGDRHILLVDSGTCFLYEIYDASPNSDGSWSAGSGAIFDLNSNALRPAGWTSADAAGYPIFPGLVRYDEVAAGEIKHALRFTAEAIRDQYIWPARHHASCGDRSEDDKSVPPMGQRFRLKAGFDDSGYSLEVRVILTAMKVYGVVLADCGTNWYVSGAPDDRWNNDDLVEAFRGIHGSDFEAVDTSSLMIDPDSAQARQSP